MKLSYSSRNIIILILILISGYAYFYYQHNIPTNNRSISSFEECAAAGYPIMESYPERCSVPGGPTFTRAINNTVSTPITITGTYTCLPKKDTGGGVTLECVFGLQTDSGYYALDTSAISDNYLMLSGNEEIVIEGTLVPIEMISSDRYRTYDIVGVIAVTKLSVN